MILVLRMLVAAAMVTAAPAYAGVEPWGAGFDGWRFTQEDSKQGIICRAILGSNIISRMKDGRMYVSMPAGRVTAGTYPETYFAIGGESEPVFAKSDGRRFWLESDDGFLNKLATARAYSWRTGPINGKFVEGQVSFNQSTGRALKELRACSKANGGR